LNFNLDTRQISKSVYFNQLQDCAWASISTILSMPKENCAKKFSGKKGILLWKQKLQTKPGIGPYDRSHPAPSLRDLPSIAKAGLVPAFPNQSPALAGLCFGRSVPSIPSTPKKIWAKKNHPIGWFF
jgi:hypothetical protein